MQFASIKKKSSHSNKSTLSAVPGWVPQKADPRREVRVPRVIRGCTWAQPLQREEKEAGPAEQKPGHPVVSAETQPISQGAQKAGHLFTVVPTSGDVTRPLELGLELSLGVCYLARVWPWARLPSAEAILGVAVWEDS